VSNNPAASRRKIPAVVLAGAGAAVALGYGVAVAKLSFGPPLVVVGLGGMTLVLIGVAVFRVIDPLLRADVERVDAPQAPVRLRELERDKQAVLKAIREIEHDYQMRKIAESDYREMVQRYRARAMRIIRELDAGDNFRVLIEDELKTRLAVMAEAPAAPAAASASAPSTTSAPSAACASCGTANDADAQFCKKCGAKLKEAS
jgi:hypothetical protein